MHLPDCEGCIECTDICPDPQKDLTDDPAVKEMQAKAKEIRKGSVVRFRLPEACTPDVIRIVRWLVKWDSKFPQAFVRLDGFSRERLVMIVFDEKYDIVASDPRYVAFTAGTLFANTSDYFEREIVPYLEFLEVTNG